MANCDELRKSRGPWVLRWRNNGMKNRGLNAGEVQLGENTLRQLNAPGADHVDEQ